MSLSKFAWPMSGFQFAFGTLRDEHPDAASETEHTVAIVRPALACLCIPAKIAGKERRSDVRVRENCLRQPAATRVAQRRRQDERT